MKKKELLFASIAAAVLLVLLLCAFLIPVRQEMGVRSASLHNPDAKTQALLDKLQKTVSGFPQDAVSHGDVYFLSSHYLLGEDRTVMAVPYIAAGLRDVGGFGTSSWFCSAGLCTMAWRGDAETRASAEIKKPSRLTVSADPNTVLIRDGVYYNPVMNGSHYRPLEAELTEENPDRPNEYIFSFNASALDSSQATNADCRAAAVWNGSFRYACGLFSSQTVPFEISVTGHYKNIVA
jgi:hypothetical protein